MNLNYLNVDISPVAFAHFVISETIVSSTILFADRVNFHDVAVVDASA